MSAPAIPAGYRRLKVGEKKPKGYKFVGFHFRFRGSLKLAKNWTFGDEPGAKLTAKDNRMVGPYIAPARKARKEGGKRIGISAPKGRARK